MIALDRNGPLLRQAFPETATIKLEPLKLHDRNRTVAPAQVPADHMRGPELEKACERQEFHSKGFTMTDSLTRRRIMLIAPLAGIALLTACSPKA